MNRSETVAANSSWLYNTVYEIGDQRSCVISMAEGIWTCCAEALMPSVGQSWGSCVRCTWMLCYHQVPRVHKRPAYNGPSSPEQSEKHGGPILSCLFKKHAITYNIMYVATLWIGLLSGVWPTVIGSSAVHCQTKVIRVICIVFAISLCIAWICVFAELATY